MDLVDPQENSHMLFLCSAGQINRLGDGINQDQRQVQYASDATLQTRPGGIDFRPTARRPRSRAVLMPACGARAPLVRIVVDPATTETREAIEKL
ncbi:MAG: hypothetical protein H0W65_06675 [Sphingomonas sp.]|uniref:hypothetical protein n=1 Tax=Sphingomonas sp. TaxID=28214 RepID=UPI00181773E9|nr:hypothetical protein [Sphingomonas sp.]MBA3667390.1 hypothetical protein [Sphingomonas sp.]